MVSIKKPYKYGKGSFLNNNSAMITQRHTLIYILKAVVFLLIISACANIVPPSGGPRDVTPPKVLQSTPDNYSTDFDTDEIRIYFDEFIRFDNLSNKLMISPPIDPKPQIDIRGKSIVIRFEEALSENTTYNLFFDDAIVDITEGNALTNYHFVFSTGSYLDSMEVAGQVLDAYTLGAMEDVYVMLYDTVYDSIPYIEIPRYITKTNKSGDFHLRNLRNRNYKIFALKDANSNFLYDLPNEKIAFLDTLVEPSPPTIKKTKMLKDAIILDTLLTDTLLADTLLADTLLVDTLLADTIAPLPEISYTLYMFKEIDSTQTVLEKSLVRKSLVRLIFRFPVENFRIEYLNMGDMSATLVKEFNTSKDSLKIWVKDSELDSLNAVLLQNDSVLDTLSLSLQPRVGRRPPRQATTSLTANVQNHGVLDYFKKLHIELSTPASKALLDSITLYEDTVKVDIKAHFKDSLLQRFIIIDYDFKEQTSYKLYVPDSIINDIAGHTNDSLVLNFSISAPEDYGQLNVNISFSDDAPQFIIQLLNQNKNVVRTRSLRSSGIASFPKLKPGQYFLKAISDDNNNERWDTGLYLKGIQPERVYINESEIVVRANWELETEWVISD